MGTERALVKITRKVRVFICVFLPLACQEPKQTPDRLSYFARLFQINPYEVVYGEISRKIPFFLREA